MDITETLSEINDNLNKYGADFTVGFTLEVPLRISFGEQEYREEIPASITEDGIHFDEWELHKFMYDSLKMYALHTQEDVPFSSFKEFHEMLKKDSDG